MAETWKLTAFGPKALIEGALLAQERALDWDDTIGLAGFEVAEDKPDEWKLDAYLQRRPTSADRRALDALFTGQPPRFTAERLPDADWVTESQKDVDPIRAGRFHVRTPEHPADTRAVDIVIPASQAFGTGQHATTAGCLVMLERMKREGLAPRNLIDVGTGTGLLAFAALALWPQARAIATDVDPIAIDVTRDNAAINGIKVGHGAGELLLAVADGMDDPLLTARAPFDLIIANILAAPLIMLAPAFTRAAAPGASILVAGLLDTQAEAVIASYEAFGCTLVDGGTGEWRVLLFEAARP